MTGVGEAARYYFGKEVADLDLAESATLAGMIRAPNAYSPFRNPERARQRRDLVLRLMREEGKIDEAALAGRAGGAGHARSPRRGPHATRRTSWTSSRRELAERYGQQLQTEGLQIYTTLDVDLQQAGQRAVTRGPREPREDVPAARRRRRRRRRCRARSSCSSPQTGGVRALVGGRDYRLSQFNRVTQAHRQPGSLFKPFVYLAAFARRDLRSAGHAGDDPRWTRRSRSSGARRPTRRSWTPRNYDGEYRGPMSARQALEHSINIPTVRVVADGGPAVRRSARRAGAGIGSRLRGYPSVALGAFEISPMEIAGGLRGLRQQRRARGARTRSSAS